MDINRSADELRQRRIKLAELHNAWDIRRGRERQSNPNGGLLEFIRYFWHVLEPVDPFVEGWVIEALCAHLEAITRGETVVIDGVERPFNRFLANVPPGFMKEVHVDEPVLTKRGRIRLGDVMIGDQILTHKGRYRDVLVIADKGLQPTLTFTTAAGRTVRAELRHPFLTPQGWVEAQHLEVGDVLAAVTPMEEGMSSSMSEEEARLIGYIVGDGGVTNSPVFTNADEEVLEDFTRCARAMGFGAERHAKPAARSYTNIGLRGALGWLENHGLRGKNSYTKRIPAALLASDNKTIAAFLGAYWSCDGNLAIRHIKERGSIYLSSCTTVSENLAKDVQHALLRLGINSRLRSRSRKLESAAQPGGIYRYWMVMTCSHEDTVKFQDLTALCSRKRASVSGLTRRRFSQGPLFEDEIVSIEDSGLGECRCLTVEEDHSFTANDIAVHNSLTVNVWWPAWEWGPQMLPHLRYVAFSYNSDLTERDNAKFRDLICSPAYREMWGHVFNVVGDGKVVVSNDKTGFKRATSFGGTGTGERGHRVLLDDPHKIKGTQDSDEARKSITNWVEEGMQNRLNDLRRDAIVIIMQRVHEEDTSGVVQKKLGDEYCSLIIPMELEESRHFSHYKGWNGGEDPRSRDGQLAWPERYPAEALASFKRNKYLWSGQYQQNPTPRGGGLIQMDWWQIHEVQPKTGGGFKFIPDVQPIFVLAALDTAYSEKEENDYSALTVWVVHDNHHTRQRNILMVDAWQKRLPNLSGPKTERRPDESTAVYRRRCLPNWGLAEWVADTCATRKVDRLIVENKNRAPDVIREIKKLFADRDWGVQAIDIRGDKWGRANAITDIFTDNMVYAPAKVSEDGAVEWLDWAQEAIEEIASFPRGAHDDLLDSMTLAMKYLRDNGYAIRQDERRAIDAAMLRKASETGRREPIYPV
jgi:predicted phage terminase large subunit-like protein